MADTYETSKHTSIQQLLTSIKQGTFTHTLMPFVGNPRQNMPKGFAYSLKDYLARHLAKQNTQRLASTTLSKVAKKGNGS
ncbi:MAG: hypothetical protein ACJASL_000798 [Paraglaciecola sp.]|jgi:hypothetical protein